MIAAEARLDEIDLDDDEPLPPRPKTRGECADGPRPCPWAACRYHLLIDVTKTGRVRLPHGHDEPSLLAHTCALDVADSGPKTLEFIGAVTAVGRERVRQIEEHAIQRAGLMNIRRHFDLDGAEE